MARAVIIAALVLVGCGDDGGKGPKDAPQGCVEAWLCSSWTTTGATNAATRTCTDMNACGTTDMRPIESATLPALDPEYYECEVEPIVTTGCSMLACHGSDARGYRMYARGRLRISGRIITETGCLNPGAMGPSEACIGNIECKCWSVPLMDIERSLSFDSARGFAIGDDGMPLADMAQSQLLRQPQAGGGYPHAGIQWWSAGDAEYTKVKAWLDGAVRGSACNSRN
jgi:hypothetical protein